MRAKFIFEKFEEESDPIIDIGIGLKGIWDKIAPGNIFIFITDFSRPNRKGIQTLQFPIGTYVVVRDIKTKSGYNTIDGEWHSDVERKTLYLYRFKNKNALIKYLKYPYERYHHTTDDLYITFDFFKEYLRPVYKNELFKT